MTSPTPVPLLTHHDLDTLFAAWAKRPGRHRGDLFVLRHDTCAPEGSATSPALTASYKPGLLSLWRERCHALVMQIRV